ncbi:MAG: hypothetical protein EB006_08560 [Betaproteobacteria bacterium]|nr:hypothetical protein [Betaproteobacteria bacterium]
MGGPVAGLQTTRRQIKSLLDAQEQIRSPLSKTKHGFKRSLGQGHGEPDLKHDIKKCTDAY